MACVAPVVTWLCGCLTDALGSELRTRAGGAFSFLGDLGGRALAERISLWLNRVRQQPTLTTSVVGAGATLTAVRRLLTDGGVDVVGIVGMGGVGKTTLLKEINNDLYLKGTGNFQVVIFAEVSREGNEQKVQRKMFERLGLSEKFSENYAANRLCLFDYLSNKRFLLLLDDLWGELNLTEIGIPLPDDQNGCKIALTTRSSEVFGRFLGTWCRRRERAQTVKVSPLDAATSWELFSGMIDAAVDLDDPSIRPHARKLVDKCGGLPLGLVTMARTMATATSPAQWRTAVAQLEEESAYHLEGMDEVQKCLQLSINKLEEEGKGPGTGTLLPCFLYCSLFPADLNVPAEDLVEYWIGEGFLDAAPGRGGGGAAADLRLGRLRDEGLVVIEKLKALSLLEECIAGNPYERPRRRCVRMHDMIREAALIFGRTKGHRLVVNPVGAGVKETWEEATRVCLRSCEIEELPPELPRCPTLTTLLMPDVWIGRPPVDWFFGEMRALVVLDLSGGKTARLHRFPISICRLRTLRYLSLKDTQIESLPKELGDLAELRQLVLNDTCLATIPRAAIARLTRLQVLDLIYCRYRWSDHEAADSAGADDDGDRQLRLCDLYGLKQLQDTRIDVDSPQFLSDTLLHRVPGSFSRSIAHLHLFGIPGVTAASLTSALRCMVNLRDLWIVGCEALTDALVLENDRRTAPPVLGRLEYLFLHRTPLPAIVVGDDVGGGGDGFPLQNLRGLRVDGCDQLRDMSWMAELRAVEYIAILNCASMETLLHGGSCRGGGGQASGAARSEAVLPKLTTLWLGALPLRCICDPPYCLPSLEYLSISAPVKSLPLGRQTRVKEIQCWRLVWDELEWGEDEEDVRRAAEMALTDPY